MKSKVNDSSLEVKPVTVDVLESFSVPIDIDCNSISYQTLFTASDAEWVYVTDHRAFTSLVLMAPERVPHTLLVHGLWVAGCYYPARQTKRGLEFFSTICNGQALKRTVNALMESSKLVELIKFANLEVLL